MSATTPAALAKQVADWMLEILRPTTGPVAICLAGGSTPKLLYELLAQSPYQGLMPWDRIHVFWGDERFVPPDSPLSNYRMTYTALLCHVNMPASHMHSVQTENVSSIQAAQLYQSALQAFYGANTLDPARPLFEIVLLGLGTNGHTASLFPGTTALNERVAWAAPVTPEGEPTRITLTYPALESARHVAFIVTGAEKQDVLVKVRAGDQAQPAARLRPTGDLHWFTDAAAEGCPAGPAWW